MSFPVGYRVECRFDDPDEWRERLFLWGVEILQFGTGRFQGDLRMIHTENVQVSSGWRSTGIMARGQVPHGCVTFQAVLQAKAPAHLCGAALAPAEIGAVRHGEDIEWSTLGAARLLNVSVDETTLERRMRVLLGEPLEHWRRHERLSLARPAGRGGLHRALLRYFELAFSSDILSRRSGARRLENGILETLISSVGAPVIQAQRSKRLVLAKKAEEYLRAHAEAPVSIGEVCEFLGINQRTFFLAFNERYGLSPMAYLKRFRLNLARRDLINAVPGQWQSSVTEVATKWGFFHLGRFAVEYRAMFGESPSETLKRGKRG